MEKQEIKDLMREVLDESIVPVFTKMLEESDRRIVKTYDMVEKLTRIVEASEKQISNLQSSRDTAVNNSSSLIEANRDLTRVIEQIRSDYRGIIADFKAELLSAKEMYRRASESYIRLSELKELKGSGGGSKADVKINV